MLLLTRQKTDGPSQLSLSPGTSVPLWNNASSPSPVKFSWSLERFQLHCIAPRGGEKERESSELWDRDCSGRGNRVDISSSLSVLLRRCMTSQNKSKASRLPSRHLTHSPFSVHSILTLTAVLLYHFTFTMVACCGIFVGFVIPVPSFLCFFIIVCS